METLPLSFSPRIPSARNFKEEQELNPHSMVDCDRRRVGVRAIAVPRWLPHLLILVVLFLSSPSLVCDNDQMRLDESSRPSRVGVVVRWFDVTAQADRRFVLTLHTDDNSIEMYDVDRQRLFLARHKLDDRHKDRGGQDDVFDLTDLYVGNTLRLLSRRLSIMEYADSLSSKFISSVTEPTFAMIKPDVVEARRMGALLRVIEDSGLKVTKIDFTTLSREEAQAFYVEHAQRAFFDDLVDYMTSGPVLGLELRGYNAVGKWRQLLGPTDSNKARVDEPQSIRARFGKDKTFNAAHGSDSNESAARELEFFFNASPHFGLKAKALSSPEDLTCCVLRPRLIRDLQGVGRLIEAIEQNEKFAIKAMKMVHLDEKEATSFLEIYKDVVDDYMTRVKDLSSGPSVVMALSLINPSTDAIANPSVTSEDVVSSFREFVGPFDSSLANLLRPHSLRGQFASEVNFNGIHCTDLKGESVRELKHFFKL